MKNFFLMLVAILMGTNALFAQDANKETDLALYQQAVKALKDKKCVLRANQFIDGDDGKLFSVSPTENYVVLEGDKAFIRYNPQYGISNSREGSISNFKIKEDKKGNIEVRMTISDGGPSAKVKFYLEKGSNRCAFTCYPLRYNKKFKLVGTLTPYVASDLKLKGACH